MIVTWRRMTVITMETYPKSGNRLLGFPAGEASFGSSEIKQQSSGSVAMQQSTAIATIIFWSCIPLSSFPLPLDSLFLTLRINPEGECGDKVSFGEDKEGLPLLSILSTSDGDKDGLLESSALLLHPSLVSPGSSFCPFPGQQTGTGRDRLSWMDLLLLGDSCSSCSSSSSSVSCRAKTNYLRGKYKEEGNSCKYVLSLLVSP